MRSARQIMLSGGLIALLIGVSQLCAQNVPQPTSTTADASKVTMDKSFPTKKLVGLNVKNTQGEKLGTISDLVINLDSGKVVYGAVSVGGVLGVGDKLFAVPYQELKFNHGRDEMHFVLDISKDRLESAPGFDKDKWPDFASQEWRTQIDNYYRRPAASRTTPTTR